MQWNEHRWPSYEEGDYGHLDPRSHFSDIWSPMFCGKPSMPPARCLAREQRIVEALLLSCLGGVLPLVERVPESPWWQVSPMLGTSICTHESSAHLVQLGISRPTLLGTVAVG